MSRRVIFLDVDGVLNNHEWQRRALEARSSGPPWQRRSMARFIDPAAVARLNGLVERSGAEVVLSSSWRLHYGVGQMQAMLESAGFQARLSGRTPIPPEHDPEVYRRLHGRPPPAGRDLARGYEIQQWLDSQVDVAGVAILDDSTRMAHLLPWLIRTSMLTGLLDEHIDEALACLERPPPRF